MCTQAHYGNAHTLFQSSFFSLSIKQVVVARAAETDEVMGGNNVSIVQAPNKVIISSFCCVNVVMASLIARSIYWSIEGLTREISHCLYIWFRSARASLEKVNINYETVFCCRPSTSTATFNKINLSSFILSRYKFKALSRIKPRKFTSSLLCCALHWTLLIFPSNKRERAKITAN